MLCLEQNNFNLSTASVNIYSGGQVTNRMYPPMLKQAPGKTLRFSSVRSFSANSLSSLISNSFEISICNIMYIAPFGAFVFNSETFSNELTHICVFFRRVCIYLSRNRDNDFSSSESDAGVSTRGSADWSKEDAPIKKIKDQF